MCVNDKTDLVIGAAARAAFSHQRPVSFPRRVRHFDRKFQTKCLLPINRADQAIACPSEVVLSRRLIAS
jgi:hypothetical protein